MQLRSEMARDTLPEVPLDSLVADSQGAMGYMIERALRAELRRRGNDTQVVTIVTEVEVDPDDPAFDAPNKPIGRFYEPAEAETLARERGWQADGTTPGAASAGSSRRRSRAGSCSCSTIEQLCDLGITVICCGGGGIPVSRTADGQIVGHEAVIDKDRVSMLLAVAPRRPPPRDHDERRLRLRGLLLRHADAAPRPDGGRGPGAARRRPVRGRQHGTEDGGGDRLPRGDRRRSGHLPSRATSSMRSTGSAGTHIRRTTMSRRSKTATIARPGTHSTRCSAGAC